MQLNTFKAALLKSGLAASVLLLASGASYGQLQQINLTAGPSTETAPDGTVIPMWGYTCGAAVTASTATCSALNRAVQAFNTATTTPAASVGSLWSPVVITVPFTGTTTTNATTGAVTTTSTTSLQINLNNHLQFAQGTSTTAFNSIPTSLTIVGQLGGGLGSLTPTTTASPAHAPQVVTWSTVGSTTGPQLFPPAQPNRVQSFAAEVAATATTAAAATTGPCWGPSCTTPSPGLLPGTYLIESGTHPSIQGPMGLYGMLVVTCPAGAAANTTGCPTAGVAYPGFTPGTANGSAGTAVPPVTYNADIDMLFSEIDPGQNIAVNNAVRTAGFSETNVWSGLPGACGNPNNANGTANTTTYNTCYPPAVNYTPFYYMINGVPFSKTNSANSLFPTNPATVPATVTVGTTTTPGSILVRLVNAGLHMHLPSIVGAQTQGPNGAGSATLGTVSGFTLIAEDGNRVPVGLPKVQSDVFMAAGKTYDVMINVPTAALPIYDRELSLSGDASERDAGMLAYISANSAALPAAATATAVARADSYPSLLPCTAAPCTPVIVSSPAKGVIANDTNVYGVTLLTAPTGGTLTPASTTTGLNANGTFTYVPNPGTTSDSFTYCANGSVSVVGTTATCSSGITATVSLSAATLEPGTGITMAPSTYYAPGLSLRVKPPGILSGDKDGAGYPLTVANPAAIAAAGLTLSVDATGAFNASIASCTAAAGSYCTYTFSYNAQNSQGTVSSASTTVTLNFPPPSNLNVTVLDGVDKTTQITDYRWIIEEDRTFYVDPNNTTNTCAQGSTTCNNIVPTFGVNFHTSDMPYVAQGCTGPLSCESGQAVVDTRPGSATYGQHIPAACDVANGVCRTDTTATNGKLPFLPSQVYLDPTKRYYISMLPGDAAGPFGAGYGGQPTGCSTTPAIGTGTGTTATCGHGMAGAPIPAQLVCTTTTNPTSGAATTTCVQPTTLLTCTTTTAGTCTPTTATLAPAPVVAYSQPSPYPPSKLSVFVFEDDFPLNGEHDAGGAGTTAAGADTLAPNEAGLGGFQIHLWDAMGGNGDFTGQMTYDMFNMPLTNTLDGIIDPSTGFNACPISQIGVNNPGTNAATGPPGMTGTAVDPSKTAGITGMIVTCPKYESDGVTLSPLAGQAVIANLMPMRMGVIATPGADRIARGEEWLQTNTLDGQKALDAFARIGEPSFFQEFGPASFHVSIGFANPAIINGRLAALCGGTDPNSPTPGVVLNCNNTLVGRVVGEHLSRTPDERLYPSGSHDAFAWTQCFVSVGDPDGEDFAFTKCAADGTFSLAGLPDGDWRITTFDQWNEALVDGLSTPVRLAAGTTPATTNFGDIANTQWQTNLYTKTFIDDPKTGVSTATATGIPLANVAVRLRDGSLENLLEADFNGVANFNETFPLFSWYAVETDVTRYKNTGTHAVYDAGGPVDGTSSCGQTAGSNFPPCGSSTAYNFLANTAEMVSVPTTLRVPGSVYCASADCAGISIQAGPGGPAPANCQPSTTFNAQGVATTTYSCSGGTAISTGRIDNPWFGAVEGWQGFPGQSSFVEFGKAPYFEGETGGIHGHVIYASTRPFDDPMMLVQTQWEPLVANVTINLYKEGLAADGVTTTLTLIDTTQTSSFDKYAQGFQPNGMPNMSCPGQTTTDLFYFTLYNQPQFLDLYNYQHPAPGTAAPTLHALPSNSQFKCYDGMHAWNQLQPAPYDGMYSFPSITSFNPTTGKPNGTNCTACIPDPVPATGLDADPLRSGLPMLPPGKYVVEIVLPPGYELVKEEDKNILIGDQFIAPATQEFAGNTAVFLVPDQASVANVYNSPGGAGYNQWSNSANGSGFNLTQSFGANPNNGIVPGFIPEPTWPCVGELRNVPDYIGLFPQTKQVAPFAGASRHLCDRKEVTLSDQMGAIAKFFVFTSTHRASKFTGGITDDYTSEFDPFSPQFGEKFAPPNLPVSVKDWSGTEISRVYADQWGAYNGMVFSTWEVNPPNPTGYSPGMMVFCMNDPGPIVDTRQFLPGATAGAKVANPTFGQQITDPLFTQGYSQFCYELPFMPATTQYLDTPVVPTSAFAGAGYNNVDCAYPDATPAIKEVDSSDGIGPWVSAAGTGHTLTIYALGDVAVPNNAYNGPSTATALYNQKTIVRHYGFGTGTGRVTIGGITAPLAGNWSDTQLTVTVPSGVPNCELQQQSIYGGSTAQCGQLVITTAATPAFPGGQQSVDTVTVTIGGKAPTHIAASASIQAAIDAANPGDLLIVDPTCTTSTGNVACTTGGATGTTYHTAAHQEMVLMWKPVRLQGVGAATTLINANTHPAGKMDPWRRQVDCLFGLAINGGENTFTAGSKNVYDPTGTYSCGSSANFNGTATTLANFSGGPNNPQVDRLPLESVIGWDATVNGNLAELLQEPSLMGALEGAGITVVAKGVKIPPGSTNVFGAGTATPASFPTGTVQLTPGDCLVGNANPYPSNFWCNPSAIDGLGITNSSQGGGGIFVHAWGHNLQIANNRIYNNAGTLSGGINLGQGEFAPAYIVGAGALNAAPGSCDTSVLGLTLATGQQEPYCSNVFVNIHHNAVMLNNSTGDELFSATPAGAGGVSICTGADYYKFNYNWVCGNLSTGDGGGVGHLGFSFNGDIEHNSIIFNQSQNPTIPTNGGGLIVMGTPDADPTCSVGTDADCVPPPGSIGPTDGIGPNLVINANLIQGNAAESGSGGGIAFQNLNGGDVIAFPTTPSQWWHPLVTNNIIVDNVAGWDGGGVSMLDALYMDFVNNTVAHNVTTATSGVLFNTFGAPLASTQGPCPPGQINPNTGTCNVNTTTSTPQAAGLVVIQNSAILATNINQLPANTAGTKIVCPPNHYSTAGGAGANNGTCMTYGYPVLAYDDFWQNSTYYIGVGALSNTYQQSIVTLYNGFAGTPAANQASTGQCLSVNNYWDIGVRGDTGPTNHAAITLNPVGSVLTSTAGYPGGTNTANHSTQPTFFRQYCDGARIPPESKTVGGTGWNVPPGIADATVPNPIFNLTPVATVDEGNNWVNLRWGPLSLSNPSIAKGGAGYGQPLGNYGLVSSNADQVSTITLPSTAPAYPRTDFYGNVRPAAGRNFFDIGAVNVASAAATNVSVAPTALNYGNVGVGNGTSAFQDVTLTNNGAVDVTVTGAAVGGTNANQFATQSSGAEACSATPFTLAPNASCTISVVFTPTSTGAKSGNLTITATGTTVTGSPVAVSGTGVAGTSAATLAPATFAFGNAARGVSAASAPTQVFTLTNTGNVNLTNVTAGTIGGTNAGDFPIVPLGSSCGPAGAGKPAGVTTLAPGANCTVQVNFQPPSAASGGTTGAKSATLSVSAGAAGTKTSTLTGTAQ